MTVSLTDQFIAFQVPQYIHHDPDAQCKHLSQVLAGWRFLILLKTSTNGRGQLNS